ncbi:MAG: hypothetical protein HKN57_01185 [Xanthomonadales bacterium]|nr:hypothetical protein [Gammaproteobacteria bacterium]MBT8053475.1 hypothetical protein [Gammaproteobacteria bacterium]NND55843.1 hypothetical protein [Xanthomonadales bacterium]NNK50937.1 hypothetical protein [Xanthomonadales bacterium]
MQNRSPAPLRSLSFSEGMGWLIKSFALLRVRTGRLLLIAVLMQVILGLTQLPLIGFLVIVSVPALSAGILEAFDVTRRGGLPTINLLFRPLLSGTHTGRLFLLGALVFVAGILSMSLALSGSAGELDPALMSRLEQGDIESLSQLDQEAIGRLALAFLIGVSVSGTLSYFTIPLIWFGDRKILPALLEGLQALVVNWRPFVMLLLGLVVMLIPVALISGVLISLAGSGGVLSVIVMTAIMILMLAFQMLLFGAQYCSYLEIFGAREDLEPPPEDDGQLVA